MPEDQMVAEDGLRGQLDGSSIGAGSRSRKRRADSLEDEGPNRKRFAPAVNPEKRSFAVGSPDAGSGLRTEEKLNVASIRVDSLSRKRPGNQLDDEAPHRKRFAHNGNGYVPSHAFRQIDAGPDSQIRALIKERLPDVEPAVVDEIWEGVHTGGRYHFHADFEQVANADIGTKLRAVGHHLESSIAESVKSIVTEVVRNDHNAASCNGHPEFYAQVIGSAPALSKILHENGYHVEGNAAAGLGGHFPIKDVIQARLPNVGAAVIDEIYYLHSGEMNPSQTVQFHKDVHIAESLGPEAQAMVARHYLEKSIVEEVSNIIANVRKYGPGIRSIDQSPAFYDQVLHALPQLSTIMQKHGFGEEADAALALLLPAHQNQQSLLSDSRVGVSAIRPRGNAITR